LALRDSVLNKVFNWSVMGILVFCNTVKNR
jgi:hypothetical protein